MTDPWLVADPLLPPLLLYAILIVLTLFFIWMEWERQTAYFFVRALSVILLMLAVTGFLLRPRYQTARSEQIVLLTPHYNKSQADSLLKIYPTIKVLHLKGSNPYHNSVVVRSYHNLSRELGNIRFILGQGLPPEALDLFPSHNYQFLPSPYPNGIIRLSIPDNITQNRPATLEGVFNNPSKKAKLFLIGPGGKEDSVTFSGNGFQNFRFSFLPKKTGRFLYTLLSEDSVLGKLPVQVQEQNPLDILFIQHYPTFETRYLKEFLSNNHRLLVRYQLSKNKFRHESVNRKRGSIYRLTKESLSEFDLVIIDTDALRSLRASEVNSLRSAMYEGLGILVFLNAPPVITKGIFPFAFKRYLTDTAHLFLNGHKKHILPAWPFSPVTEGGTYTIIRNQNRVLTGYQYQGFGKIGFQLLQQTYQLILQGDSIAYSSLWWPVLERLSRSNVSASAFRQKKSDFPLYPDAPVPIEIISSENDPDVLVNDIKIPMEESILIDDLWKGKFWFHKAGWNQVAIAGDTAMDLYISNADEWQSLATANAMENTRQFASSKPAEKKFRDVFLPLPPWIFYLLFLLGAGFLWLAPKL
ncbi:MAG: hypothetical protein WD824_14405 [Cyclobacteriaceae bacterium]